MDIIVPSFRLNEEVLLGIVNLAKPDWLKVDYYIISDNPHAMVPPILQGLADQNTIHLFKNHQNIGAPATRNEGIRMSKSKWILFLDDDIKPADDLLFVYSVALAGHPDAIGFAGTTIFPAPFNAVTKALSINGTIDSFTAAERSEELIWTPTSNVLLNREKMSPGLFDPGLVNAEDIDFLTRNSLRFKEKYQSLPEARVYHPWWNDGRVQTKRMISYGTGASQIARRLPISQYTYYDFTNTSETVLLLLLAAPICWVIGWLPWIAIGIAILILAEYLTAYIKMIVKGGSFSPLIAWQLMWVKNVYEFGRLRASIRDKYWRGFAQRTDMGFNKPNPSHFRTNKWKFIKTAIIILLIVAACFLV